MHGPSLQPKAATPGCTKEACKFRDEYAVFQGARGWEGGGGQEGGGRQA